MEFALITPVLLLMMFGLIEWGTLLFTYNAMEDGARSAARALAVCAVDGSGAGRVAQLSLPSWIPASSFTLTPNPGNLPAGNVGMEISIPADQAVPIALPFVPIPSGNITATVAMRQEPLAFDASQTCSQAS